MTTERSVLCPGCGYDLRAATEDRCSECGLVIDRASLLRSGVPWAHRREIGRARAFFKTVWLMTLDARSLRNEAARPQSPRDAGAFRRWVMLLLAACLAALCVVVLRTDVIVDNVVQKPEAFDPTSWLKGYEQDLAVPWSAGIAWRPAWFGYALLVAVCVAGAPAGIFRTKSMPPEQAQAARAMGAYVAAPLVWLVPAAAMFLAEISMRDEQGRAPFTRLQMALMVAWMTLLIVAVGSTVHRTGQWKARVTRRGYATGFLAMGELLLRWGLGIGLLLCVVPWCVGFLILFIRSLGV